MKTGQDKYRSLIENLPDAFAYHKIVIDGKGEPIDYVFLDVNSAFENMTGLTKESIIGKKVTQVLPGIQDTSPDWINTFSQVSATGESASFEQYSDSLNRWYKVKSYSDEQGNFATLFQDITDIKHTEEALKQSQNKFSTKQAKVETKEHNYQFFALFENMTSGAAIYEVLNNGSHGRDYIIKDFNKVSLQIEGKEKDEVLGKSLYDLRPNIDQYGLIPVFQKVWKTGTAENFPTKVYIDYNFCNYYENKVFKLPTGEIVAIYDDVTDRMVMHEKLIESENKLGSILDNINDVVWTTDINLQPTYVSPSIKRMIGEFPDEHMKRALEEKFPSQSLNLLKSIIVEEFEIEKDPKCDKNRIRTLEVEHYRADGTSIWVEMNVSFIRDENDKAIGFQGVTRDISDRKRGAAALQASEEKYRHIFNNTPLGVVHFNNRGIITDCNNKFIEIIGSSHEVLVGLDMSKLPDKKIVQALEEALRGQPSVYEGIYKSYTATKITPVRVLFAPILSDDIKFDGGMAQDIQME